MSRNLLGTIGVILVAAAVLTFGATNASAELILNGSFEDPGLSGSVYNCACYNPGDGTPVLTSWDLVYSSVTNPPQFITYMREGGKYTPDDAYDGDHYLNPAHPWGDGTKESASQTFNVTAGLEYTASFWQLKRGASATLSASVALGTGGHTGSLGLTTNAGDSVWTEYTFSFTPDTTTTATLTFTPGTTGDNGVLLDSVSVTAIPEPGTLALLATGLIGLLCYAWRKRKCVPR